MRRFPAALCLLLVPAAIQAQTKPSAGALWAFRYGVSRFSEQAVFADGKRGATVAFAWLFYALQWEGRWIVIDPGFDDERMRRYFAVDWIDPLALLREAGIRPGDVSLVLLTHGHFDHAGLADKFPKARIVMSEAARRQAAAGIVPESKREFFRKKERIDTFQGRLEIEKGVTLVEIGGHSSGSSIITMDADKIVFTGDEAYLPENWTGPRLNGTAVNPAANLACLETINKMAGEYLVLAFHDPAVVTGPGGARRLR